MFGLGAQAGSSEFPANDVPLTGLSASNSSPTPMGSVTAFTATITGGDNVSYAWNFGDGATGTGATTTHLYGAIGAYTAMVTATNAVSTVVATTPVTITEAPITGLSASNSSPTPVNSATAFTATVTGGSNIIYQWNFGDGATASGATTTHTYSAIGFYTAMVTATNSLGSVVATTSVTITDTPITGLSASNSSPTPLGSATSFTATITAGSNVSYQWNFGDGVTAKTANASHTYLSVGYYTARVTATNSLGSVDANTPVTITDTPITGLSASNSSPTRLGKATFFTATTSGGSNVMYAWNFGDGNTATGANAAHLYLAVGSYTARVTATNGVSVVATNTPVSILDTPITGLNASNSSPTTLGNATTFTATISSGSNVSYAWNFGDGVTGSGAITTHTYTALGNYMARVTATNGVSLVVATTPVTITDAPITGLAASSSSPTTLGSSTAFTATLSSGTNVNYTWDFGDGVMANGKNVSHTYLNVGSYTARVTATNSFGGSIATTNVSIVDKPISGLSAASSSPTRLGSSTAFTATIADGSNVSYAWNFGDGTTGTGANITHLYGSIGSYIATVTATNSVGSMVANTTVNVLDAPITGLSATSSSPTRLGSVTALTATITDGSNVSYAWNFGDGTTGSGRTPTHLYSSVGAYTAQVTATNSVSTVVATTSVSIIDTPITGLSASNSSPTTLGDPTFFSASVTGGSNVTYQWNFGDGATATGSSATHTYGAVGTYTAQVTATNGVSVVVANTFVSIIDRPITGLSASNSSPTRLGSATAFTATITDGSNVAYQWNFGDGNTGSGAITTHTYGAIGSYTATVTATNGVSVVVATTPVSILDIPIAGLSAANSSPTRLGSPTLFTATVASGTNINYTWNFGDGATGNGANASHVYLAVGSYTARVTATNSLGSMVATTSVSIIDTPITGLSAANSSPTKLGDPTVFLATTTGGSNIAYQWNFGDGATATGSSATHTYGAVGTYTARVTATNGVSVVVATTPVSIYQIIYHAYMPLVARDYTPPNSCGTPQPTWQGTPPSGVVMDALLIGPKRDGKVMYAGAATLPPQPGLYISRDGGLTWPELRPVPSVLSFAANPVVTTTIYAGTFRNGLYQSMDEGVNWNSINTPNTTVWSLAAVQTSSSSFILFAGTDNGIYYTATPGSGWVAAGGSIAGKIVYAIVQDPENGELFAATSGNGVYKSSNGGITWNSTALSGVSVLSLAAGPGHKLYAGLNLGGVYGSSNGGASWSPLSFGMGNLSVYALAIDPLNAQKIFAGTTDGGVFMSTNGAAAWSAYNSGLSTNNIYALAINPACYGTLFAGTDNGVWRSDTRSTPASALPIQSLEFLSVP